MSPIGRIFSVLNLILAALFLGWAANNLATSHDFKNKLEAEEKAHTATKTDLDAQISELRTSVDTKTTEADTYRNERDDAEAHRKRVVNDNTDLKRQVDEGTGALQEMSGAVETINATLGSIESAKDDAVSAQREAESERDGALQSAQDANTLAEETTQKNSQLENTIADLRGQLASVEGERSSLETQLATLVDVTGVSWEDIASQEKIDAAVVQVNADIQPGLLALSKGSADGVKRGYTFEIYKGSQYKGQVRVENVRENMCTALIVKTMDGQTIAAGDNASTRL